MPRPPSVSLCSSSLRMSMRSPGSAQLAPDGVGTMVNCTVKSEGKKEPCHEALQGSAAAAEPQPRDPARAPQDAVDSQAPAQVPCTFPGAPGSVSLLCLCSPHPRAIPTCHPRPLLEAGWAPTPLAGQIGGRTSVAGARLRWVGEGCQVRPPVPAVRCLTSAHLVLTARPRVTSPYL